MECLTCGFSFSVTSLNRSKAAHFRYNPDCVVANNDDTSTVNGNDADANVFLSDDAASDGSHDDEEESSSGLTSDDSVSGSELEEDIVADETDDAGVFTATGNDAVVFFDEVAPGAVPISSRALDKPPVVDGGGDRRYIEIESNLEEEKKEEEKSERAVLNPLLKAELEFLALCQKGYVCLCLCSCLMLV